MKISARRMAFAAFLLASVAWTGCTEEAGEPPPYRHNRFDYWLLRDRFPDMNPSAISAHSAVKN